MNKRGEIATAVVVLIAIGAFFGGLVLPKLAKISPFKWFSSSSASVPQDKTAWAKERQTVTPIFFVKDGQAYALNKIEREVDSGTSESERPLTLVEKIRNFFSRIGTIGIIFIIVSLVFFGGTPIVWLWAKFTGMRTAYKNTVIGIKNLKETDPEAYTAVTDSLSKSQNTKDKKIVDEIKKELH